MVNNNKIENAIDMIFDHELTFINNSFNFLIKHNEYIKPKYRSNILNLIL